MCPVVSHWLVHGPTSTISFTIVSLRSHYENIKFLVYNFFFELNEREKLPYGKKFLL